MAEVIGVQPFYVQAMKGPATSQSLYYCKCELLPNHFSSPQLNCTSSVKHSLGHAHPEYHAGICFNNFTIVPLFMPQTPHNPCLSCTRQFCLDQKLPICRGALRLWEGYEVGALMSMAEKWGVVVCFLTECWNGMRWIGRVGAEAPDLDADIGTGKEGDVEARCFSMCTFLLVS